MRTQIHALQSGPRRQGGVVLFISLIVLVALTLAGLALMQSVTGGVLIAGNLAAKQTITNVGDLGVEAARSFVITTGQTNEGALSSDDPANGYFATWGEGIDPTNAPAGWWKNNGRTLALTTDPNDPHRIANFEVRWVVQRLCKVQGSINLGSQECVSLQSKAASGTKSGGSYSDQSVSGALQPYYRATARVIDPRGTVTFVQTVFY